MSGVACEQRSRRILAGVSLVIGLLLLGVLAHAASVGMSGRAWDACRDRVIAELEAAGLRDFGDVSAYTGATGTGAIQGVIEACGYRSEQIDHAFCNDLYSQVYLSCREDGFDDMSMAAPSRS